MVANLVAQLVFIIVAVEAFGNLHAGLLWSLGIATGASLVVMVVPVAPLGRIELKEK